MFIIQFGFRP